MIITLDQIQAALNAPETIFMKQGKGGKVVHISAGACRDNNLLCGVTYSRNGRRASYLFALTGYKQMETESMCKNCVAILESKKVAS